MFSVGDKPTSLSHVFRQYVEDELLNVVKYTSPFLDGGKILVYYLPYNAAKTYERYSLWLMFGFMFFGFGLILTVFTPVLAVFDRLLYSL